MASFEIVKTGKGNFVGATQEDHKAYERHKAKLKDMEPGEFLKVKVTLPRSLPFHRRFMAMVRFAFEQWEPEKARKRLTYKGAPIEKNFEQFRKDMLILAGYHKATYDRRGRVTLDARSISFDQMEDDEFREVYAAVYEAIYQHVFVAKGYTRETFSEVLAEYERFQPT